MKISCENQNKGARVNTLKLSAAEYKRTYLILSNHVVKNLNHMCAIIFLALLTFANILIYIH
ncbi:hypothetical protein BX661DRAFT_183843, partial [Kickxella alabastrina]|uniref:uncharacterized protein n=1 Tax=Kickxella alabastrina TaxID=61397 RepID=UPI00221FED4C